MDTKYNGTMTQTQRVITFLDRKQVDFLDRLGKDALFSTGSKLSRTKIISAVVDVLMHMNVSGKGVHTPEELGQKINEAVKNSITM